MATINNDGTVEFTLPNGDSVPIGDPDRTLEFFQTNPDEHQDIGTRFWSLIQELCWSGLYQVADIYLEKYLLSFTSNPTEKAESFLRLGTLMERKNDYAKAAENYT